MEQQQQQKPQRTEKQRAASRANGTLSHGPVTPEGKAASSRNSLRHGLRAQTLVLANEHSEILDTLIAELTEEFQPETNTEHGLVLDMAYAKWRQYRTWLSETGEINKHMLDNRQSLDDAYIHIEESVRTAAAVQSSLRHSRALDLYNRAEGRYARQYHRALVALTALQKNKKCTNEPEPRRSAPPASAGDEPAC
jgi:hypothetical protein